MNIVKIKMLIFGGFGILLLIMLTWINATFTSPRVSYTGICEACLVISVSLMALEFILDVVFDSIFVKGKRRIQRDLGVLIYRGTRVVLSFIVGMGIFGVCSYIFKEPISMRQLLILNFFSTVINYALGRTFEKHQLKVIS